MKIREIQTLLSAKSYSEDKLLFSEVLSACGSDMMSDVLAFVKDQGVLLTGLNNPQVIRTADMMDMKCVVYVRGKEPDEVAIELAKEKGICILSTKKTMFSACGILYNHGLRGSL